MQNRVIRNKNIGGYADERICKIEQLKTRTMMGSCEQLMLYQHAYMDAVGAWESSL